MTDNQANKQIEMDETKIAALMQASSEFYDVYSKTMSAFTNSKRSELDSLIEEAIIRSPQEQYFEDNWTEEKLHEMYWWPFFYNGKILNILNEMGEDEFLTWFEKLVDYPKKVLVANDLDIAVEQLIQIEGFGDQVEDILDSLIERNPKYYDYKQKWKKEDES